MDLSEACGISRSCHNPFTGNVSLLRDWNRSTWIRANLILGFLNRTRRRVSWSRDISISCLVILSHPRLWKGRKKRKKVNLIKAPQISLPPLPNWNTAHRTKINVRIIRRKNKRASISISSGNLNLKLLKKKWIESFKLQLRKVLISYHNICFENLFK